MSFSSNKSYKRLGDYIEPCNEKNDGNLIKELRGISNRKYFQKAKTNTIGVDLSKYRIVRTGQFAFNRATTRNGDKISIGLRFEEDCIVSPSYRIFKSKDENVLNSEYLMMWFRRPDFDRYARFKSHGSAHEFFDYREMCEVELPIPSIEKQRAIVKEYNTVVNRIKLNETLNQKLEETAQALYKHWFVDFEFPFDFALGKPSKDGKPYKSNGGKMTYNEEMDKEIPVGWEVLYLSQLCSVKHGYAFKGTGFSNEETNLVLISPGNFKVSGGFNFAKNKYYNGSYSKDYVLKENDLIVNMTDLSKKGDTLGSTALIPKIKFKIQLHNQRVGKFLFKDDRNKFYTYFLTNQFYYKNYILGSATGTTVRHTSPDRICDYKMTYPNIELLEVFNNKISNFIKSQNLNPSKEYRLRELKDLLLSKMTKVELEKGKL